jgi:hypothetical protein
MIYKIASMVGVIYFIKIKIDDRDVFFAVIGCEESSLREDFFSRQPAPIFGEAILQRSLPVCALRLFIFAVVFKGIHELASFGYLRSSQ